MPNKFTAPRKKGPDGKMHGLQSQCQHFQMVAVDGDIEMFEFLSHLYMTIFHGGKITINNDEKDEVYNFMKD